MIRTGAKFALLFGCYLLLAGQLSTDEVIAGVCCAAAAAAASFTVPFIAERHFSFAGVPWAKLIGRTLASLASDVPRVGMRLLRPVSSAGLQRWPLASPGDDPRKTARRALVTLAASLAPNSYVAAVLGGRGELLVHSLAPAEPPHDPEWPL